MKFEPAEGRGRRGMARARGGPRFRHWGQERTTPEQRQQIRAWVAGRMPAEWAVDAAEVRVDDDEILVVTHLPEVDLGPDAAAADRETAEAARIGGFREESRDRRMQIAGEAEQAWGRALSWGAACGTTTRLFTTASVPVMTRLRIDERLVLDTLVDAGVARSRSDALAWCVRLVARNEERWITDLRDAFRHVEDVRSRGPGADAG